jgi:CHAT domain-containing protein
LAYARRHYPATAGSTPLVISAADIPGAPPLPGAAAESRIVADLVPDARVLRDPSCETVLSAIPVHPIVHFACHASTDLDDPAASALVLPDYEQLPLTVARISALRLNGSLAVLSGCDTAVTSLALSNESVHITGAFHLAGYQNVIGTFWPANDHAASRLARVFYRILTLDGTVPPDTDRAARALHQATRQLRNQSPSYPAVWAAFTHTGI